MIGKTISHYKILEKLGSGGMGEVYLAEDTKLNRKVALKFLPKEFSRDPEAKKRFMDEARSSSHLDHPNICVIHEINETNDGQLFISMNYCKGENLQTYIKEKDLTRKKALQYIIQVAKGLEKAHNEGIVHCDIKPTNIIITNDSVAKIVDFGIAKIASEEKLISKDTTSGTIAYMSPEQVGNTSIDVRTDIWSLGVVFYEMLTKQVPFIDSYNEALMYSIINEEPESITSINPEIPPELEQIILKMITKNPADRYQQVSELITDLKSFKRKKDFPVIPKILKSLFGTKNRIWFSLISLFLLIVVISTVIYFTLIQTPYVHVPSIGILNMENLGDEEDDFWSRGITEDLIINIASAGIIRVPTIKDVNRYKESEYSLADIAEKLRVDYLLSSSIFISDSTFDLWCRMLDPKTGKDIFTKKWSKPLKSVSTITTILAGTVLNNLGISSKKSMKVPVIVDPEAYELYLKGKNIWEVRQNKNDISLARSMLQQALEKDEKFLQAKIQLGKTYSGTANFEQAIEIFNECLDITDDNDDERTSAVIIKNIGTIHIQQYEIKKALENFEKALKIVRKYDDKYNEGKILLNIGNSHYYEGNNKKAEEYYLEASLLKAMLGDVQGEGEALYNLGTFLLEAREYDAAINSFKNSFNLFRKIENKSSMGYLLWGITYSYMGLGKIEPALNYVEASLQYAREISDKRLELNSLIYIGEINYWTGIYEKAHNIFLQTEELAHNTNDTYLLGISHQYLGQLMLRSGNSEKAFKHFEKADSLWIRLDDPTHRVWTQAVWANAALKFGDKATAAIKSLQSESILKDTKPYKDYAPSTYYNLYNYYLTIGDTSLAKIYLSNANNEILNRLKYIDNSINKNDFLNRIVVYREIIDSYETYFEKGDNLSN